MINDNNIQIFDYIFSINMGYNYYMLDKQESFYLNELDEYIKKVSEITMFWDKYANCIAKSFLFHNDDRTYKYNMFPRLNLKTKKDYLNYKLSQIKNIINEYGDFIDSCFENITENIINVGKMEILNYCQQVGIIRYSGKVFISADNCPACKIIYDNIKAVLYTEDEMKGLITKNIIIVKGDGNSIGTIEQNLNSKTNDEKLFKLVLSKLELLKKEGISKEDLKILEEMCNKKDEVNVLKFLKKIATGTIESVVATGILSYLGL